MAALTALNAQPLYNQGGASLIALFALRNVNTGDTLDINVLPIQPAFQVVKLAVVLSDIANATELASVAGTVVTMPAGLNKASAYLLISGC